MFNHLTKSLTMKNTIKITFLAAVISVSAACKKETKVQTAAPVDSQQMKAAMTATSDRMKTIQFTKDPDVDFALILKTQQQGVIDIANLELTSGSDNYLKDKAKEIITKNAELIKQLAAYIAANPAQANDLKFDVMLLLNKVGAITEADLNGKVDHDFATLMLGLHQAGVDISKLELAYGHRDAILQMANKIIVEHQAEVQELKAWLIANKNK
ncbi:MAG: hypothetical protein JWQ28_2804 [Pedobacter sp.]|nr:hypothetical protein [Pedobacter sp.]